MMWTHNKSQGVGRRITFFLIALVATGLFGIGFAACGGEDEATTPEPGATSPEPGAGAQIIEIVSKAIAFDKSEIRVTGGEEITIRHDNQDDGIPHNFAIYKTSEAKELIAGTEIEPGPVQQELIVGALEPGEYFFRCDTHPTQMTGTLIVEE